MQFYTNLNRDSKSLINSFTNDVTTLGKNSIINLDYVNPLTETTKLELGLEARDESTANLFRDNAYSSDFTYDRTIYWLTQPLVNNGKNGVFKEHV
jgi:hypothetical protein